MEKAPNSTFETCIICMEEGYCSTTDMVATQVTRCGHCFHAECYYASHLSYKQRRQATRCPFCTSLITTQNEAWIIQLKSSLQDKQFLIERLCDDEDKVSVDKISMEKISRIVMRPSVKLTRLPLW